MIKSAWTHVQVTSFICQNRKKCLPAVMLVSTSYRLLPSEPRCSRAPGLPKTLLNMLPIRRAVGVIPLHRSSGSHSAAFLKITNLFLKIANLSPKIAHPKTTPGAITVWYSSKFPLLYSLYVRSYTGTALGPQSGVLVAPFNIRGAKPKFPGRMQNFKTLLLARVRVLRRKSFRSQKGSTAGLKTHGDQGQNAKGRF